MSQEKKTSEFEERTEFKKEHTYRGLIFRDMKRHPTDPERPARFLAITMVPLINAMGLLKIEKAESQRSTQTEEGLAMKIRLGVLLLMSAIIVWQPTSSFSQISTDPKIIEGAKKEGEVVWYTSMALDQSKVVVDRFQKKFPAIKPTLYRSSGGPLMNKILTEARAGRYLWDISGGRGEMIQAFGEKNLLAAYRSPETSMIDPDLYDKDGYWYVYYVVPNALGYNTKLVKKEEVPKTYEDLLLPKWKGRKISMDESAYLILQGLISVWGREKAVDYMKKLAAQDLVISRGNTERVTMTGAGEYPLVIAYAHTVEREKFKGAPVDWVALEPAIVEIDPLMIGSKAPNPNAARLFLDFLLSKEGQEMLLEFQRIPVRKDVEPKPSRLFRGYQRLVERPNDYKYFSSNVKLFQEIFKTR